MATANARFVGDAARLDGGDLAMFFRGRRKAARLAVGQRLPGQGPADGAVTQGGHRVGHAGIDQRLGADDAAGAPGAVDDNARGRIRRQFTGAQHQFGTGHADAGGDAHGLVFLEAAGVEHHHVGVAVEQRLHFFGGQGRRVTLAFHQFAKGLARHVHVNEQLATGAAPAVEAAFEQADLRCSPRQSGARRRG